MEHLDIAGREMSIAAAAHSAWRRRLSAAATAVLFLVIAGCASHSDHPATGTAAPQAELSGPVDSDWFDTEQAPEQIRPPHRFAHDTVWPRIAKGYQLQRHSHPLIDAEVTWFRQHPAYVYRITERSHRYLHYVLAEVQQRGMPAEIALLPMIESGYNPFAYSRSGAAGMWQFMPITAGRFKLNNDWWYDGRKDVVASTEAALTYLTFLHKKFDNDWLLAVAAYNFGEGNIQKAIDANRRRGRKTDFWNLELRAETRAYVPRLLAFARVVGAPQRYGINLYPVANRTFFTAVEHRGQVDLHEVAQQARLDPEEILRLNAAYAHGFTDPNREHRLLVPVEAADRFRRELGRHRSTAPSVQHYQVARGDTLGAISRRFAVPVELIQSSNGLTGTTIQVGQALVIPAGNSGSALATLAPPSGSRQILHTIQRGEVLWRVARRYSVTPQQVARWNGLKPDEGLRAGERLSIWTRQGVATNAAPALAANSAAGDNRKVGYTVRRGDSLYGIASRFKVQIDDIVRWNGVQGTHLYPGQKLTLYVGTSVALN